MTTATAFTSTKEPVETETRDRLADMHPNRRREIVEKLEANDAEAKRPMRERILDEADRGYARSAILERLNDERCVVLALDYYVLSRMASDTDAPSEDIAAGLSVIARSVTRSIEEISDDFRKAFARE